MLVSLIEMNVKHGVAVDEWALLFQDIVRVSYE